MPSFSDVDKAQIILCANNTFWHGEPVEKPEIVIRNVAHNISSILSFYHEGFYASLVLERGLIVGLKIKTRRRRVIPLVVQGNGVTLAGVKYKMYSQEDAATIARAILEVIERGGRGVQ